MRQDIKAAAIIGVLALSATAAAAQTRSSPAAPSGQMTEVVCLGNGAILAGGRDPDANIRLGLVRDYSYIPNLYLGKARAGATRCEPPR